MSHLNEEKIVLENKVAFGSMMMVIVIQAILTITLLDTMSVAVTICATALVPLLAYLYPKYPHPNFLWFFRWAAVAAGTVFIATLLAYISTTI
jgi:hypothetical protein